MESIIPTSRCWTRRLLLLWTRSSRIPSSRRRSASRSRKPKRRALFHDLRLLSSDWRSCYSIRLYWFVLCYSSWWQLSGIRYKMGRSSIIYVKSTIRWCSGKSVQIENTWVWSTQNRIGIVRHGDSSSEDMDDQRSKVETMVKRSTDQNFRWRNFDARHGRIESGAVVKSRKGLIGVEGGKGICYQWKEKRPVFEGRPV